MTKMGALEVATTSTFSRKRIAYSFLKTYLDHMKSWGKWLKMRKGGARSGIWINAKC